MRNYKDTLNLPNAGFSMKANLKEKEPKRIEWWEKNRIYFKNLEKRKNGPVFILHDGPPYSNGHIHLGTALNKVLKDILVKYKSLKGYYAPYIPGWDNHGMPIEMEVMKQNKELKNLHERAEKLKDNAIKIKIREECRKFAGKWVNIQKEEFRRLGVLGEWDSPYLTMDRRYEARELEVLADFVEKGYVYRGFMPIHWCPRCRTTLAMAEIEYKDKESPSLWFRMEPVKGDFDALVWTTTPWTIISNVALAVHPDFDYVVVETEMGKFLLAEGLLEANKELLGWKNVEVVKKFKGGELEGLEFKHPFYDRISPVILADFVTLEDGTGIVHIAPGHGKEDFEVGREYNLPVISPVDEGGRFTEEARPFTGLDTEEASNKVVEVLKENGKFVHLTKILHSYPHCWRCKGPLVFRATHQWFLSVDHKSLREKALEEIKKVRWHPEEGENRIYASVKERPDWVISRQRTWGVHIPSLRCKKCGHTILSPEVIRNLALKVKEESSDAWLKYDVKEFLPSDFKCPKCGGSEFDKDYDILDVWFDSGISYIVVSEERGLKWPSDVYLEGSDQHRGWFNASLMLGAGQKGSAPYKDVITHGWVVDEQGRAMHKSLGNVIKPEEIISKYGADVLRLWISHSDYTEDVRLGPEILARIVDSYRKIRNTFRFMLGNLYDFDPEKDSVDYDDLFPQDKYILLRWEETKKKVDEFYSNYYFHKVYHTLFNFIVVDLSSFYLDILKDRLYTWGKNSTGRKAAQTVIYNVLKELLITMYPILSFTVEEAWENLPGSREESVYLADWPSLHDEYINMELKKDFEILMKVRDVVLVAMEKARKEKKIIQDRLEAQLIIEARDEEVDKVLRKFENYLSEIFIVSQVKLDILADVAHIEEDEFVRVGVRHAEGNKCQRCWIWHPEVGKNGKYPDLCPKCVEVMEDVSK